MHLEAGVMEDLDALALEYQGDYGTSQYLVGASLEDKLPEPLARPGWLGGLQGRLEIVKGDLEDITKTLLELHSLVR